MLLKDNERIELSDYREDENSCLRNVAGELLSAKKAVEYAILFGYEYLILCYDFVGIKDFALRSYTGDHSAIIEYNQFMLMAQQKINIKYVKIKSHSGDMHNDRVDKLAKMALKA